MGERRVLPIEEIVARFCAPLDPPARAAFTAFIDFGRAARLLAQDVSLPLERRQSLLDGLAALFEDRKPEVPLALPLAATAREVIARFADAGVDLLHARHLLQALRQDCTKAGYRDWGDWLLFARFAAAPYGRLWIESSGADKSTLPAAEALACALLLLNETQDCVADWRGTGKVYLPERWLRDRGALPADLALTAATPAWRGVFTESSRAAAQLLGAAAPLPGLLRHKPQRKAAAAGLALGRRWAARLAAADPLRETLCLSGWDRLSARLAGWRA